ncbi:hypothetical protein B0H21DRAFT_706520 [Amylocystis lapponica]|nr:hypothetical protein B0H21DRAFT_706520 [Amylocystis lapponica]
MRAILTLTGPDATDPDDTGLSARRTVRQARKAQILAIGPAGHFYHVGAGPVGLRASGRSATGTACFGGTVYVLAGGESFGDEGAAKGARVAIGACSDPQRGGSVDRTEQRPGRSTAYRGTMPASRRSAPVASACGNFPYQDGRRSEATPHWHIPSCGKARRAAHMQGRIARGRTRKWSYLLIGTALRRLERADPPSEEARLQTAMCTQRGGVQLIQTWRVVSGHALLVVSGWSSRDWDDCTCEAQYGMLCERSRRRTLNNFFRHSNPVPSTLITHTELNFQILPSGLQMPPYGPALTFEEPAGLGLGGVL